MNVTPAWQAAVNGLPTNQNAVNASAQANQMLGTHVISPIYEGTRLVTPSGGTRLNVLSVSSGNGFDLDQPFTLPSGSTVGRVTIPVNVLGTSSDVLVSLYPDNGSGAPNTNNLLSATLVPAAHSATVAAPQGLSSAGPLATARFNTLYGIGSISASKWAPPSGDSAGAVAQNSSVWTSGNFLIAAGGITSSPITSVNTIPYIGKNTVASPVAQPPLPKATFWGSVVTTPTALVYAGGTDGVNSQTAVWVAGWNPTTGSVGSWSSQTALPVATERSGCASSGETVYIVGGFSSPTSSILTTVRYATLNNGQIGSWNLGPPIPQAVYSPVVSVLNGWLIVAGGSTTGPGLATNAVYFSKIFSDGSLGSWSTGPSLPIGIYVFASGWDYVTTDNALVLVGGTLIPSTATNAIQTLSVTATGLSDQWYSTLWRESGVEMVAAFSSGSGTWNLLNTNIPAGQVYSTTLTPVTELSVPLPASGLTAGSVYHVVLQQKQVSDIGNSIQFLQTDDGALPFDMLKSPRHSNSWAVHAPGFAIPMSVYDNTVGGSVLHTWEDPSAGNSGSSVGARLASRSSTLIYNSQNLIIGLMNSALVPNNPIDINPTFTAGVGNWTATNCTFVQSNSQVHGGFPFSGLMTPNGTSATVFVESNKGPVSANVNSASPPYWYQAQGWVYSPTGYSSVSLSVKWYDSSNNLLSTSSNVVSVPAATWTYLNNYFVVPVGAAQATLVPTESGTPAAGNTLFLSNVLLSLSPEASGAFSDVSQITYPSTAAWPPTGVVQLV